MGNGPLDKDISDDKNSLIYNFGCNIGFSRKFRQNHRDDTVELRAFVRIYLLMVLTRNTGSAKRLEGCVYVITFFVSEVDWPLGQKMDLFKQIRDAESWLEHTASIYGKKLRFVNGVHGLFEPFDADVVSDYNSGHPTDMLAIKYLKLAGCPLNGYHEWVKKNSGCDQSLFLIIANSKGRGYANCMSSEHANNFPEGAILYHSSANPLYAGCIIHEILHLFGAADLYAVNDNMKEIDRQIEKMYPKEVMHRSHNPLRELMISPLTAWLVGLTDKKEPWFDNFLLSP